MQNIQEYLTTADLQILVNRDEHLYLNLDPSSTITYFKKMYIAPEIFIKDEIALKNIGMKWNETTFVKIPKDIHLLGKVWLKVQIPYFQMLEKLTTTTTSTTNDANVNEMIYDNNETYLIIYSNKYYLIPDLFLELPDLSYNEFKFKFSELKKYFIDLASANISDDTNIIFYSFNMNNFYVHDIIPTVLNLTDNFDKLTLNKLLNGKDRYKQNLLTQNSFDNYITKIVEDEIINDYQNIQKFDSTIDSSYYNFMSNEFDVLYNYKNDPISDVYLVENYINTFNVDTVDSIDKIKQNTITKTSLVYEYIITDLNPSFEKTFNFYKKIATITTDSIYSLTLTDANLLGGETITGDYPIYTVDISSLNLPFTLTTDMIITTANDLSVTYTIVGTDNIFTVNDTSTTTSLDKLKLIINTNNNTLNEPNINVTFPDTNSNSEWTDNLLINLGKLDYNKQLEILLFYQFKKNYFSKESIITNDLVNFTSSVESIKRFWIELKVVEDRFKKRNSTIGFNNDEWNTEFNTIYSSTYNYIVNIEEQPKDIFNVYCIIVNKLYDTLKEKYFSEFRFIKFFYNKIFAFMYQRYYNISKLQTLPDFKGLLFYYNIDLLYYIDKEIIKHYLLELFYMESYIGYVPLLLNPLQLEKNNIKDYLTTAKTDINTSNYFHELKYENVYYLFGPTTYIFKNDNTIAIYKSKTNYIYYNTNLVEFKLELYNTKSFINVLSYSIDDTFVYLVFDTSIYTIENIKLNAYYLFLHETIKMSVPVIYPTDAPGTINYNNIKLFDKSDGTNLFINYATIFIPLDTSYNIIMKYTLNNQIETYDCYYNGTTIVGFTPIPISYTNYDKIELTYWVLPTTTINISNGDCNRPILETFPFIEIKKASLTPGELALFTTGNTIRLKTINPSGGYYYPYIQSVIKKTDLNTIYLYCYFDGDITSYTTTINANGLDAVIFENSYLPNLYNYTSLNTQTCETNDYMIQKPTIIALKTTGDYVFIMNNFPKMKASEAGGVNSYPGSEESFNIYIDNQSIIKIHYLDCNQLIRNGLNLYSSHFDNLLLSDQKYISTIRTIVETEYDGIYEDIYKSVVDLIETSQNEYVNSYTEILDYVDTGYKLGKTLQEIAIHTKLLNNYTLTSNLSDIKIGLTDTTLVDFDSYTILATSLYNFTNRDGNTFSVDNTMISALGYKYNTATMKIINSPWHCYRPYVKINPIIIKYLDRYSSYSINMLNNINSNLSALQIVNNKNFPQEFNNEYQMKSKYYHLINDTNQYNITSNTINIYNFSSIASYNYIKEATVDGKTINYSQTTGGTVTGIYSTGELDPYKYKPVYDKTPYNNTNCYYNLVGAVSIISNKINNNFTLPDYLIADNRTIITTDNYKFNKIFSENFYGINYNCLKLELDLADANISVNATNNFKFALSNLYVYTLTASTPAPPFATFVSGDYTTQYIVSIDNQTGFLTYDGTIITLHICKNIVFNIQKTIYYETVNALGVGSDTNIFNAINNNTQYTLTNTYEPSIYNIKSIDMYNKYHYNLNNPIQINGIDIDTSKTIILEFIIGKGNTVMLQTYGKSICKIFSSSYYYVYFTTDIDNSQLRLTLAQNTPSNDKIPPVSITYDAISFYNPFENVSDITNPNSWLIFKNTSNEYEFQFKNIDTTTFANGNYLVYYNNTGIQPTTYKYPDRYKFQKQFDNKSYNQIANIITSGVAFDIDTTYKYVVSIYDNTGATLLYTKLLHSISTDKLTIYLEPQKDYIYTTTYYEITTGAGASQSYRPIILTTLPVTNNYKFTNTSVDAMVTYTGDSLTYIDDSADAYTNAVANIRITNIIHSTTPGVLISTSLTTSCPFISISTETVGPNTYYVINLLPKKTIGFDYYNMIELYRANNEKIILWLYLNKNPSTNKCIPRRIANNANTIPLTEPMRYNNNVNWYVKTIVGDVSYVYNNVDANYYNVDATFQYITLISDTTNDITIDSDTYYNFNEVLNTTNTRLIETDSEKYIKSILNPWSYIKYIETINGIYIDDLTLQKFNYFIFITSDNKRHFNIKLGNTTTGIQVLYNLDFEKADVYIYDYKPIFINCDITYNIVNDVAYVYISRTGMDRRVGLERNEIIRIGYDVIQITRWSKYYNCFIGTVLYSSTNIELYSSTYITKYITMNQGYYSFGVLTNYLSSNTFLKNINDEPYIFYKYNNMTPIVGEYYIKNNVLYQYVTATGALTGYIFKQKDGCYIDLYYIGTSWYYDDTLVNLKAKYTINYNNDVYIIDTLSGSQITWVTAPAGPATDKVRAFVPYQPFEIISVTITSKELNVIYNGWLELYIGGALKLYKVNNGIIQTGDAIADNTYTIRTINLDTMNIKNDFNNSLLDVYNNSDISIKTTLQAKDDAIGSNYVYFTTGYDFLFSTTNIHFVYYQSIIINNIWYNIIDVINNNIYVNVLKSANIFTDDDYYEVIFSAANVNDSYLISNKQILRNSAKIEYPIMKNNSILTTIFKGNNNFNTVNYNASINTTALTLSSPDLYNQISLFANNSYVLTPQYYYENYIPMSLNVSTYVYSQSDLSIFKTDKTLLLELTEDGSLFQHYIDISIIDYVINITSSNTFQNIKTSFFYLHNIVPCIITNYNNLILLPPEYNIYRKINNVDRKLINSMWIVIIKNITPAPTYTNNKWKYQCITNDNGFLQRIVNYQFYVNGSNAYIKNIQNTMTPNATFDLYIDDYQETFTYLYYYLNTSVSEITPSGTTTKSEYSNITTSTLNTIYDLDNNYQVKQINRLYLSKVNTDDILVFKDNTSPTNLNVNFGDIDNIYYVGKNNLITYSTINTTKQYLLDTTYSILDTTSTAILYNITIDLVLTNPYYCIIEPETSTTEPSLELYINDEGISVKSIVGHYKPWKDWTLITSRYNLDLKSYLNNYAIVYDGTTFTTAVSANTFYTNDEIADTGIIKTFLTSMYKNGTINSNAKKIFQELLLVETYLFPKLINYFGQRFFWDNITSIINKILANYTSANGYTWTITNNILCIEDEFTDYPEHFELVDNYYVRKNYLSKDYTITYAALDANIKVERNANNIDTNIGYVINNSSTYNLDGTSIDNVIRTLLSYSTSINNIKSTLPLYYNYMDSVKYYISKLYFGLLNNNNKLGILTQFNRKTNLSSSYQYYGKYYNNEFKVRYFGINGLNHYSEITNSDNDIMYIKGNIVSDLYSYNVNDDDINKLTTNNLFNYVVSIDNNQYENSDLIKASNTYTIDIKDNYNHLVDPVIENVNINTNSLEFKTTEMVQPTDISILSSEPYNIQQKTDYGLVVTINTTTTLSSNYDITIGDVPILYIKDLGGDDYKIGYNMRIDKIQLIDFTKTTITTLKILSTDVKYYKYINLGNTLYTFTSASTINDAGTLIDSYEINTSVDVVKFDSYDFISTSPTGKVLDKVVIKTATKFPTVSPTITKLTFSANYNNQFIYIYINNTVYPILYDIPGAYYYIDSVLTITTNEIYTVFKTFIYTINTSITGEYISDITVDKDINPIAYNQVDTTLPMVFSIDNLTINKAEILTSKKLRLTYNIDNTNISNGTILNHNYRLNESIPYEISTVVSSSQYYYQVNNTYKMSLTDIMTFNTGAIATTISKIENNIITFNTGTYYITDDLNDFNQIITKNYTLTGTSYLTSTVIKANVPSNLVNANSNYILVETDGTTTHNITNIIFDEYLFITTDPLIPLTGLKLRQTITDTNHTITQNENNQAYTITTTNNIKYLNLSSYFIPIIQTLDSDLKEFDAKYFYTFTFTPPITFTFGDFMFAYYNDVYIKALTIMKQSTSAIIGTNTFIPNGTVLTLYSADLTQTLTNRTLNNIYYTYYKGEFVEYVNSTTFKILLPMNSLYNYNKANNTTTNKVIINFKYTENNLINNTYPLVGFNKVPDITSTSTITTNNYVDVEWIDYIGVKLFKSIELLIDDNIVEKINPNIYSIYGYYFLSMFKRDSFNELIKIKQNSDNSYYYYIPIPFYFTLLENNYIPISSMSRSTIKIKFVLEKLDNLISNKTSNSTYTLDVIPNIDFNYSFLTLDNKVLNKFMKTDLLITPFYYYQNFLLNKVDEYNHISLLNRTIELFFITHTKNDTNNFTSTIVQDDWYKKYLSNNPNDSTIFNTIDAEISANSYRYQVLKNHLIIKNYSTRFAMYLDTKYLVHINENLNNPLLKYSNKLTALSLYFTNIYKNNTVYTYQQIIDNLNILINGKELLPELPTTYHNDVIPYFKGMALQKGYHLYGFNFYSLVSQPNGFINMKKIKDFLIYSHQTNTNQEYKLKVCTREYKILKIDNLTGKLL